MKSPTLTSLLVLIPILMIDAVIELSFICYIVAFLHGRATGTFSVDYPLGQTFKIQGHPSNLLKNQGHTSNGSAGTALVLVGIGGLMVIWLQKRGARITGSPYPSTLFTSWALLTILSALFTLSTLIYTFVVTRNHDNQTINLTVAVAHAAPAKYPLEQWTPENWLGAIFHQVPLTSASDRRKISQLVKIARGGRWNLIPLTILGTVVACIAVYEWVLLRRQGLRGRHAHKEMGATYANFRHSDSKKLESGTATFRKHFVICEQLIVEGCTLCSKKFRRRGDLIKHLKSHKDKRLFRCSICLKSFNRNDALVRHQKEVHS